MPKKNRVAIYEYLFKEGVLVAKKDFTLPKHPEIDVPNLHVIKALTVSYLTRRTNKHHILLSSTLTDRPGLATYFCFSFRFFKKGSCQLLAKVCARSTG